jgi:Fe-S cluster biogenesis protein NfuA/nitrite reductase/ring-hydroxylating ferredoxin subunit
MPPESTIRMEKAPAVQAASLKTNGTPRPADELSRQSRRVQELVDQVEALPDPAARALLQECLQSILVLHGQGLARVLEVVRDAGSDGQAVLDQLIHDGIVRGLLLIHGLHPVDLKIRLQEALAKVRPYMESHGGNVELLSLENDVARLRLQGTCKSCPSSAVTLELAVRHALEEACPDLMGFEVEGAVKTSAPSDPLQNGNSHPPSTWVFLDGLGEPGNCDVKAIEVEGIPLVICKLSKTLFAYRNMCPACGLAFQPGPLEAGLLKCPLGHRYDAQCAGAGVDKPDLHLHPFPLLVENGRVKVSVR